MHLITDRTRVEQPTVRPTSRLTNIKLNWKKNLTGISFLCQSGSDEEEEKSFVTLTPGFTEVCREKLLLPEDQVSGQFQRLDPGYSIVFLIKNIKAEN